MSKKVIAFALAALMVLGTAASAVSYMVPTGVSAASQPKVSTK